MSRVGSFLDEMEGAHVNAAFIAGGLLVLEISHRGTDEGRVRLTVPESVVMAQEWPFDVDTEDLRREALDV